MEYNLKTGQKILLPAVNGVTPIGAATLKKEGRLKTKFWEVLSLYTEGTTRRVIVKNGKQECDKILNTVLKLIKECS